MATLYRSAHLRSCFKSDKYQNMTSTLLTEQINSKHHHYHPHCHKDYTAVKRSFADIADAEDAFENGLLKNVCFVCGNSRRKKKGKEDRLIKGGFCDDFVERSQYTNNKRIHAIVDSGINIEESQYHRSCQTDFRNETKNRMSSKQQTPAYFHEKALESVTIFINSEIVGNRKSFFVSHLLKLYKDAFIDSGGKQEDICHYEQKNLLRKLQKIPETIISCADFRHGSFMYSEYVSLNEAKSAAFKGVHQNEAASRIKEFALYLRSIIMNIPKTKTPRPTNVHNLKQSAPNIPEELT